MMLRGLACLLFFISTTLTASVYVDGYSRADGTYVEGHYRSSPNDTVSDNYSTDGNENPYTGEEGTREVYDDSYNSADVVGSANAVNGTWDDMPGTSSSKDNTGWIILGIIIGLAIIIAILKSLGKRMFFSYLAANIKFAFSTWIILTIVNQFVFFGACLRPDCILASIPHVSLITLGIIYLSYKSALSTYDATTGYNQFGYNKEGFDKYGYRMDGYDKNGYNANGFDRDGKDRLGKGSIGRFFAGSKHNEKIAKMNEGDRKAKADADAMPIVEQKAVSAKKTMIEMDQFSNEPKKETSRVDVEISTEKILKELGIDSATRATFDAKKAKLQKELADFKAKKRSENMPTQMYNNALKAYKKVSDKAADIKNFRLYYKDKPANLVWYGGEIIYVPKDYFLMKNLMNINHATGRKCILYKSDIALIDEMKANHIVFTLAEDIEDLINRLNASGMKGFLSEEVGIETTSYVDYSQFNKPIYDEDGSWEIKS